VVCGWQQNRQYACWPRRLSPFGPLLVAALWNGSTNWGDLWAYVLGPILGGLLAAFAYDLVARPHEAEELAAREAEGVLEPAQGAAGTITGERE
jgi:hypothetical protein